MRIFKITFLTVMAVVMSAAVMAQKPRVRIIAAGDTIAGVSASSTGSAYGAGQAGILSLTEAVLQGKGIANVTGGQLANADSQDMNDEVWLKLAKRVDDPLNREGYDGVLITHGTDTMEDTACLLSLTGRPTSTTVSAHPVDLSSERHGVAACMKNELSAAKELIKSHTTDRSASANQNPTT